MIPKLDILCTLVKTRRAIKEKKHTLIAIRQNLSDSQPAVPYNHTVIMLAKLPKGEGAAWGPHPTWPACPQVGPGCSVYAPLPPPAGHPRFEAAASEPH